MRHILDFIESLDKEGEVLIFMWHQRSIKPRGTGLGEPVCLGASKETQTEKSVSWKLMTLQLRNFI